MSVMIKAVPHFTRRTVSLLSAMTEIRLMMICIRSCISKTHRKRMKNKTGTLLMC